MAQRGGTPGWTGPSIFFLLDGLPWKCQRMERREGGGGGRKGWEW